MNGYFQYSTECLYNFGVNYKKKLCLQGDMNTCIYLQWAASGRGVYCMKCVYDYGSEMLIALSSCTGLGFVLFVNLPVAANESTCLSGRNFVGGGGARTLWYYQS